MSTLNRAALRAFPRATLNQPVQIVGANQRAILLIDISIGGLRIRGPLNLKSGDKAEILWVPVSGLEAFKLETRCLWKRNEVYGLEFLSLNAREKHVIQNFVNYHRGTRSESAINSR